MHGYFKLVWSNRIHSLSYIRYDVIVCGKASIPFENLKQKSTFFIKISMMLVPCEINKSLFKIPFRMDPSYATLNKSGLRSPHKPTSLNAADGIRNSFMVNKIIFTVYKLFWCTLLLVVTSWWISLKTCCKILIIMLN